VVLRVEAFLAPGLRAEVDFLGALFRAVRLVVGALVAFLAVFFATGLRVAGFFTEAFLVAGFFELAFLVAGFLVEAFFAVAFLVAGLRVADFFAVDFLAVVRLVVALRAVAFLEAGLPVEAERLVVRLVDRLVVVVAMRQTPLIPAAGALRPGTP
jgi:hypothetical protein